ncbi:hypothetical protein GCM10020367_40460 [Streptomyces sannanensis]|uniref:Amino acid ABC transporter permease n=1 Tax=Streptomyces sannanensis TaxID=285536 RepID=A0ABP6SEU2_9ACTN
MSYSESLQELLDMASVPRTPTPGGAREARMSLASAAADGSGGSAGGGELKHSHGPWTSASGTAGDLRTSTEQSRSRLRPGHEGATSGLTGLSSLAALTSVLDSWEDRLTAVRDECGSLQGSLATVAKEMGETDDEVGQSVRAVAKSGEHR